MSWNPDQYDRFRDQRLQPAIDLLSHVPSYTQAEIVDLGCGSGAAFQILGEKYPKARLTGVERDGAMLDAARRVAEELKLAVELVQNDIEAWQTESTLDVIFSNAVLHWLPDHQNLLPRLMGFLVPGGCLAVQMPNMWNEPVHLLLREVAGAARWQDRALPACRTKPVLSPQAYDDILRPLSDTLHIWENTYPHNLEGEDAVFNWIKGSSLKPVLDTLQPGEQEDFSSQYAEALRAAYPMGENGKTLYPMKRLFIVATTPASRAAQAN